MDCYAGKIERKRERIAGRRKKKMNSITMHYYAERKLYIYIYIYIYI